MASSCAIQCKPQAVVWGGRSSLLCTTQAYASRGTPLAARRVPGLHPSERPRCRRSTTTSLLNGAASCCHPLQQPRGAPLVLGWRLQAKQQYAEETAAASVELYSPGQRFYLTPDEAERGPGAALPAAQVSGQRQQVRAAGRAGPGRAGPGRAGPGRAGLHPTELGCRARASWAWVTPAARWPQPQLPLLRSGFDALGVATLAAGLDASCSAGACWAITTWRTSSQRCRSCRFNWPRRRQTRSSSRRRQGGQQPPRSRRRTSYNYNAAPFLSHSTS